MRKQVAWEIFWSIIVYVNASFHSAGKAKTV